MEGYTNEYDEFLGKVDVAFPSSGKVGSDSSVTDMLAANRSRQRRYRVYTNAKNKYNNFGSSLGITYNIYKKYTVGGNLNYNFFFQTKDGIRDDLVTGVQTCALPI